MALNTSAGPVQSDNIVAAILTGVLILAQKVPFVTGTPEATLDTNTTNVVHLYGTLLKKLKKYNQQTLPSEEI